MDEQQPIPQDINKWKSESHAFLWYNDGENDYVREDALIPLFAQLQECKKQLAQAKEEYRLLKSDYDLWLNRWQIDMDANKKTNAEAEGHRIIAEARGHAIVELTDELDTKNDSMKYLYAEIESLNQQIGQVKESLLFANDEIESLKQENEELKVQPRLISGNVVSKENFDYWRQRCDAAEKFAEYADEYGAIDINGTLEKWEKYYDRWQTLKQQTHG